MLNQIKQKNVVIKILFCLVAPVILLLPIDILFSPGHVANAILQNGMALFLVYKLFDFRFNFKSQDQE